MKGFIIFCKNCGRTNYKDENTVFNSNCINCENLLLKPNDKLKIACNNCGLVQDKEMWNFKEKCQSCGKNISDPLKNKCWGRTINKGHDFIKFSVNLKKDEMDWLKKTSAEHKVQIGQILRLLIRIRFSM